MQREVKWWDRPYEPSKWDYIRAFVAIIPYLPPGHPLQFLAAIFRILVATAVAYGLIYLGMKIP